MKKEEILIKLNEKLTDILAKFEMCVREEDKLIVVNKAYKDLIAFSQKDPSAHGNAMYILDSYLSYQAVWMYRLSNMIAKNYDISLAKKISEISKLNTGIEIHPSANIGSNFVIDHGIGTVIGETVSIGDDCYFLQNIILGSKTITNNKNEIRHPQIGNNVEIGGYVRIYGNISIGDNVKISPDAIIRNSVPSNTTVVLGCGYQIIKNSNKKKLLYQGYRDEGDCLTLFFNHLEENIQCYIDDASADFELCMDRISIRKEKEKNYRIITLKSTKYGELMITI